MVFLPAALFFAVSAAAFDIRYRKIPDLLNAFFFCVAAAGGLILGNLPQVALFFAIALAFSIALYRIGVWGGGDAKFFSVLSSFFPLLGGKLESVAFLFLLSSLLFGLTLLPSLRGLRFPNLLEIKVLKNGRVKYAGRRMAFAPFLAISFAMLVFFK